MCRTHCSVRRRVTSELGRSVGKVTADDIGAAFEKVFGVPLSDPEPDRRSSLQEERDTREIERHILNRT
jgi:hypothetical protein